MDTPTLTDRRATSDERIVWFNASKGVLAAFVATFSDLADDTVMGALRHDLEFIEFHPADLAIIT